ncbi:MAG: hypothetical protein ACI81R_001799 [Bradymonadia bacterium]
MTVFHVFYIPALLSLGVFVGMWLGNRNTYRKLAEEERRERERAARKATRAAKTSVDAPENGAS